MRSKAMDSKKKSQEFSSIDESPVTSRSLDTNLARINLQKLQDHVNKQFSNISNLGPCAARAMSSDNRPEHSHSLPLGRHLIQRPLSIKDDDDLFRGESDSEQSEGAQGNPIDIQQEQLSKSQSEVIYKRDETDVTGKYSETIRKDRGAENELENETIFGHTGGANIPNFSEIGLSVSRSSKSSDTAECHSAEDKHEQDLSQAVKDVNESTTNANEKNQELFNFKVEYRSKRSQSDVKEKRKRFSQRDDLFGEEYPVEEVFEEEYPVPVRKSNSLPDLILSLSGSSSSSRSNSEKKSPDVISFANQKEDGAEIQKDRKTLKDSFEGKSSFEKPANYNNVPEKRKPSLGRSVSFNEKTDCRYYQTGESGLSSEVTDEKAENQNKDNKPSLVLSKQSSDSDKGDQDKKEENPPQSPADGRRQLFSRSSGYQTGSDHSRESHETQNESFHDDTFHGDDSDSQIQRDHNEGATLKEMKMESEKQMENVDSDRSTSGSSNDTILDTIIDESLRYTNDLRGASAEELYREGNAKDSVEGPSPELPLLSIIDRSPQSSLNNYKIEKKNIVVSKDNGIESAVCDDQNTGENLQDHLLMSALDFKRSQSTLGQSMQSSFGNVPKLGLLDESVVVAPSLLAKVDEEDKMQMDHVRRKYTNPDGSINNVVDESMQAMSKQSLQSSYLQLPSHLMEQEFEEILIKHPNDAEKIAVAFRKLMESGSSSPGHSPFEFGDGRNSASSPKNKLFTVEELEMASRCSDTKCSKQTCEKMRRCLSLLELDFDLTDTGNPNLMLIHFLESIYQHSQTCEDLICPVLYCQKCLEWCPQRGDPSRLLQEIKAHIKNPLSYLEQRSEPRFIKLQDSIRDTIPQQFITYIPLSLSQESGKSLLAQDLQTKSLCVIREYPLFEDNHQISALKLLRNLDHPQIVPQLWMLEYSEENILHICTQFMQGGSLRECLDMTGHDQLPWLQVVDYMKQITDAVCFLHSQGVIYLYWESSCVMFPNTRRELVKLSDFAFSHCVTGEPDIGALKQCLPFNLCPPELLNDNTVCEKSDSWGAACLLAEMLTGTPVWYDLRHKDRQAAQKEICNSIPDMERELSVDQKIVFECCWKMKPSERSSIKDLNKFLNAILTRR